MAREIEIELAERSYRVVIDEVGGWIGRVFPELQNRGGSAALVTDDRVGPLWGPRIEEVLAGLGWSVTSIQVPAGEKSKALGTLEHLYTRFTQAGLRRDSWVIALGGGVVGDLAGLAAATWMRGIDLLQVPTSLLAMSDSSVGGKVGIDFGGVKNLVGAFHQPRLVLTAPEFLATLADEELANGLAEVIKAAIIGDEELFGLLESQVEPIWRREPVPTEALIARAVSVKARIVEQDEREAGLRQLLNLGHTLGHAIEAAARLSGIRHGEAVAIGIVAACQLSILMGVADEAHRNRIERLLVRHRLPTRFPGLGWDKVVPWLQLDKKARGGGATCVLTGGIGDVSVHRQVPEPLIRKAAEYVLA